MLKEHIDRFIWSYPYRKVTPGGVIGVSIAGVKKGNYMLYPFGSIDRDVDGAAVSTETIYDLASLTKPLATVLSLLSLIESRKIRLNSRLDDIFPIDRVPREKRNIKVWELMSHCSRLPAHRNYFIQALSIPLIKRKDFMIDAILSEDLLLPSLTNSMYSDLGYILLGYMVEEVSGTSLDAYFHENIAKPFGVADKLYFSNVLNVRAKSECAPTEVCPWANIKLRGEVHDDNCRVMGGTAGHAGLFGKAEGVLQLCETLRDIWKGESNTDIISQKLLRRAFTKVKGSTWTLGFDTPTTLYSSSGKYFTKDTIGHLGFTGTSFWIDLRRGIVVTLLTNRVNPSRKNERIKKFRPQLHNAVMEGILQTNKNKKPLEN